MEKATVLGMVIPMPKAAAAAPNVATDLQTQFNGASTTGYISFKAPETQFDGTTLATNKPLSYTITANNKQVATGTVLPGQVAQTVYPSGRRYEPLHCCYNQRGWKKP